MQTFVLFLPVTCEIMVASRRAHVYALPAGHGYAGKRTTRKSSLAGTRLLGCDLCWLLGSSARICKVKEDYDAILHSSHNFPGAA